MEEDLEEIHSPILNRPTIQKQFEHLENVVEDAKKKIEYAKAHDENILKAIEVVERFLRRKKRVCYGGQAINSLLPKAYKFYDSQYTIPDYDFFSPTVDADATELIEMLQKEGFTEMSKKAGIHEGTMKIFVNYVAVADCTFLDPRLFSIVQKRAHTIDGILYSDPDFLRMMMHLELSRPRGDVDRWKKVFERLTLLNYAYPIDSCEEFIKTNKKVGWEDRQTILEFSIKHKLILLGPEGITLYFRGKKQISLERLVQFGGTVVCMSKQAKIDAEDLKDILGETIRVEHYSVESDSLFPYSILYKGNIKLACILQEEACIGYTNLMLNEGLKIRVGMPDSLLHIYYSFLIFGKKEITNIFQNSLQCLIEKLYTIVNNARVHPTKFLPAFSMKCSGHQKGKATLLKERVERSANKKTRKIKKREIKK